MKSLVKKIFLSFTTIFIGATVPASAENNDLISKVLQLHIEGEYNSGVVVGVNNGGHEELWFEGQTDLDSANKPNEDTLFEIGSITKVFVGIILADLVLEGIVNLDDPIAKYLPALKGKATGDITLVELSTHTSGLPRLPTNFAPSNIQDPYADYREQDLIQFLMDHDLDGRPTAFDWQNYSNAGVGLLGYVLTKATHVSFEQLLLSRITEPLGMHSTTVSLSSDQLSRFATPYNAALERVLPWHLNVLVGAGGVRSTLRDMMKFLSANMNPESVEIGDALTMAQVIQQSHGNSSIGLGWGVTDTGRFTLVGHGGGTGGFASYIGFDRARKVGFVSLTNTASDVQCLATYVFSESDCTPDFGFEVDESVLESYVGAYGNDTGLQIIITRRKGYLVYELVGQEKNRMKALSENKFDIMGLATVTFVNDASDGSAHFIFEQGNSISKFERVAQ